MASWSLLAPGPAILWQLGLIIAFYVGPIVSLFAGIVPRQVGVTPEIHARTLLDDLADILAQISLHVAFMRIMRRSWWMRSPGPWSGCSIAASI